MSKNKALSKSIQKLIKHLEAVKQDMMKEAAIVGEDTHKGLDLIDVIIGIEGLQVDLADVM